MKFAWLIVFLVFSSLNLFSQDGSPDFSFGNNGIVETDINGNEEYVNGTAQAPSGRIVVVGETYDIVLGIYKSFILAYHDNGAIDTSFGDNGLLLVDNGPFGGFNDVKIQVDEKIITSGFIGSNIALSRFLPDGTVDDSFATNGNLFLFPEGGSLRAYEITQDGKFLILGSRVIDNIPKIVLKRFLSNGDPDNTFGTNGAIDYAFGNESSLPSGTIQFMQNGRLVIGSKILNNGITSNIIVRLLADGSPDISFGNNGIVSVDVEEEYKCAPLLFPDGRVLVRCSYFNPNLEILICRTLKLNLNGSLNISFGKSGYLEGCIGSFIQENHRILDVESFIDFEGGISIGLFRYLANGTLDSSFNFESNYAELWTYDVDLQNNGKILIAGSSVWYNGPTDIVLQRYNNNPLSIPEQTMPKLIVSPNPSPGIFTVQYSQLEIADIPFQIFDITGKILSRGTLSGEQTTLDLSMAQSGLYFLNAGNSTLRLLKQ